MQEKVSLIEWHSFVTAFYLCCGFLYAALFFNAFLTRSRDAGGSQISKSDHFSLGDKKERGYYKI